MIIGFKTANSTYHFNQFTKTITGGYFRDKVYNYVNLNCLIGSKAYITLLNGQIIETGIVTGYIEA